MEEEEEKKGKRKWSPNRKMGESEQYEKRTEDSYTNDILQWKYDLYWWVGLFAEL